MLDEFNRDKGSGCAGNARLRREAFASQTLAVAKELGLEMSKTNVNGGAIALGHSIGCSGARILVTLLYEMKKRELKRGLATLCIGGGMGLATVVEIVI